MTVMNAAEWSEFKAWMDALDAPKPAKPVYVPSAQTFDAVVAPDVSAPAFTPAERRFIGTPVDHTPERHEAQRTQRIDRLMRERVSTCG